MKKIFNSLLALCGLVLALHVVMTVIAERTEGARWAFTEEGQAGLKTLINRKIDPFDYGGDPANSALVLDFRGEEEPRTIDAVASWIFFDFEGRGEAVRTGWVGPGLGLLVWDRDGDGLITSGRELFGNHTLGGDPRTSTGFEALAKLDENGDGLIDRRDSGWEKLRVWLDQKPDGRVGNNELHRLEQLGVAAVELKPEFVGKALRNGNHLQARSSFVQTDGRSGGVYEIFFQRRAGLREFRDGLTVSPEVAASVPDLKGYGRMRPLREALMQSPELKDVYRRYQNAATRQEQLALLDELLLAWSRSGEAAPAMAERLGDRYDLAGNCLEGMNPEHLRRLEVMEAWWGRNFYRLPHELYPGQELLPGVETGGTGGRELKITCPNDRWQAMFQAYDQVSRHVYEELLRPTRLKRFYDRLDGAEKTDFSLVLALFEDEFALDPEKALTDLMEFRLDLARGDRTATAGQDLDDYIKGKAEQIGLTPDQRYLFDRFSKLGQTGKPPAASQAAPDEVPGGTEEN